MRILIAYQVDPCKLILDMHDIILLIILKVKNLERVVPSFT